MKKWKMILKNEKIKERKGEREKFFLGFLYKAG